MGFFYRLFGYRPSSSAPAPVTKSSREFTTPPSSREGNRCIPSNSTRSNSVPPTPIPIDEDEGTVVASTRSNRTRKDISESFISDCTGGEISSGAVNQKKKNGAKNINILENDDELYALIERVRSTHSSREPELSHDNPSGYKPYSKDQYRPRAQDDIIINNTLSTLSDHKSTGLSMERIMYLNIARTVSSLSLDMSIETCHMKEDLLNSMAGCPVIGLRDKAIGLRDSNIKKRSVAAANGGRAVAAPVKADRGVDETAEQDPQEEKNQNYLHTKRGRSLRRRFSDPGTIDSIMIADLMKRKQREKENQKQNELNNNNGQLERFIEKTAPDGKNRKLARALQIKNERDKDKSSKKALLYEVAMRLEESRAKRIQQKRQLIRSSRKTLAQGSERRASGKSGKSLAYEVAKKREKALQEHIAWKKKLAHIEKRVQTIQKRGHK